MCAWTVYVCCFTAYLTSLSLSFQQVSFSFNLFSQNTLPSPRWTGEIKSTVCSWRLQLLSTYQAIYESHAQSIGSLVQFHYKHHTQVIRKGRSSRGGYRERKLTPTNTPCRGHTHPKRTHTQTPGVSLWGRTNVRDRASCAEYTQRDDTKTPLLLRNHWDTCKNADGGDVTNTLTCTSYKSQQVSHSRAQQREDAAPSFHFCRIAVRLLDSRSFTAILSNVFDSFDSIYQVASVQCSRTFLRVSCSDKYFSCRA